MRIRLESIKKLQFPPAFFGYVTMEIDLIQIDVNAETWSVRRIDECWDWVQEKDLNGVVLKNEDGTDKLTKKQLGTNERGFNKEPYTFEQLSLLCSLIPFSISKKSELPQNIIRAVQFLQEFITKKECHDGISGIEGKGMYFSEAQDWIILIE